MIVVGSQRCQNDKSRQNARIQSDNKQHDQILRARAARSPHRFFLLAAAALAAFVATGAVAKRRRAFANAGCW